MFGRTGSSKKIIVVADIGSGSAGVVLLIVHPTGPATVVASSRTTLPFEERNEDATIKGVIASLADASTKALALYASSAYKDVRITSVYAVIRAPWTRSKTARGVSKLEKEMRITDAMIGSLAKQAIAAETDLDRNRLIESAVVRVELNGYATGSPVGKTAHSLSVIALLSDCNATIRAGVEETLMRTFPHTKPVLRSGARALISAVRVFPDIGKDYVILDMESEATTILVVRDGLATEHAIVPEGVRSILKRISEKSMPEETLSLMRMVENEECNDETCKIINESVARVEIDLARVYGEGLTRLATPERLPIDLILIVDAALSPWLTKFFSRIDFTQCTLTAQPFSVQQLDLKNLAHAVVAEGATTDTGLSIASALVNTEEQS